MDTQPNQRLIAMLGTLYNTNTIEIQKKINAYVSKIILMCDFIILFHL